MFQNLTRTQTVYRIGLRFQIPASNFCRFRYTVHPDGSGTGWDESSPDVNQPHGLDYRSLQDVRKGVRKRIEYEHSTFADVTVGGNHLPGGCRILGIVDSTSDLTKGAGDASIDVTQGKFIGRGLIYEQGGYRLWCYTNYDGTTASDPFMMALHPDRTWGSDVTWTGAHEFDASVDITGNVALDGDISIDSTVACGAGLVVDGTAVLNGNVVVDGTVTFASGAVFNHLGDWSARAKDTEYQAASDGEIYVTTSGTDQRPYYTVYTDSGSPPTVNRARARDTDGDTAIPACVKVKKGDYWKVTDHGSFGNVTVYWLPFGDNT